MAVGFPVRSPLNRYIRLAAHIAKEMMQCLTDEEKEIVELVLDLNGNEVSSTQIARTKQRAHATITRIYQGSTHQDEETVIRPLGFSEDTQPNQPEPSERKAV